MIPITIIITIPERFTLVMNPKPIQSPRKIIIFFWSLYSFSINLVNSQIAKVAHKMTKLSLFNDPLKKLNCGLKAQREVANKERFLLLGKIMWDVLKIKIIVRQPKNTGIILKRCNTLTEPETGNLSSLVVRNIFLSLPWGHFT